jgi:hypothetical protein
MAQQKGIIKLGGKIVDISFYKTQDGHLAREKGGLMVIVLKMIRRLCVHAKMAQSLVLLTIQVKFLEMRFTQC